MRKKIMNEVYKKWHPNLIVWIQFYYYVMMNCWQFHFCGSLCCFCNSLCFHSPCFELILVLVHFLPFTFSHYFIFRLHYSIPNINLTFSNICNVGIPFKSRYLFQEDTSFLFLFALFLIFSVSLVVHIIAVSFL